MQSLLLWRNGESALFHTIAESSRRLVEKARREGARSCVAAVHECEGAGHYGQTDVPAVFEHGPLRWLYKAIKGGGAKQAVPAREVLKQSIVQILEALDAQGWLGRSGVEAI